MNAFVLHPQLAQDTHFVPELPAGRVLLMNESRYPWLILVPRRANVREIIELSADERTQLWAESDQISRTLMALFQADKLNLGALGNLVPQLHLHHLARFQTDAAWPAPVWGKFPPIACSEAQAAERVQAIQQALVG